MNWWGALSSDEQWGILVTAMIFACALTSRFMERRPKMGKPNKYQGSIAVMEEPPGDLLVAWNDELKRIREARTLLQGCSPSIWSNDLLYDLDRWEREVQGKLRRKQ